MTSWVCTREDGFRAESEEACSMRECVHTARKTMEKDYKREAVPVQGSAWLVGGEM